jgi:hypothetical protein
MDEDDSDYEVDFDYEEDPYTIEGEEEDGEEVKEGEALEQESQIEFDLEEAVLEAEEEEKKSKDKKETQEKKKKGSGWVDKWMTKYEYARLIGSLASMIENAGLPIDHRLKCDSTDSLTVAEAWLNDRSLPFPIKIVRNYPDSTSPNGVNKKEINVRDLILPSELENIGRIPFSEKEKK